jgi:hypothetical protein
MIFDPALLIVAVLIAIVLFFLLKDVTKLIINSILGLLLLFIVNYFDLMSYLGQPDVNIDAISVLMCVLGGIPGALIVIILQALGYSV